MPGTEAERPSGGRPRGRRERDGRRGGDGGAARRRQGDRKARSCRRPGERGNGDLLAGRAPAWDGSGVPPAAPPHTERGQRGRAPHRGTRGCARWLPAGGDMAVLGDFPGGASRR